MSPDLVRLVDTFTEGLYIPDPGAFLVTLATVAANRMRGDAVYLLLVGPSSGGKTVLVNSLASLPEARTLSTTTKAGLLSGSTVEGGTGGVLLTLPNPGLIVIKDLTSLLSEHTSTRNEVLAIFREVHEGRFERGVGSKGGQVLRWEGKAGVIACATEAVDSIDIALFGERWIRYRLPPSFDRCLPGLTALDNIGYPHEGQKRREEAVASFFADLTLPERVPPPVAEERERLAILADIATRCRSSVVRGGWNNEFIELVPHPEEIPRFTIELAEVSAGLQTIGVDDAERWRLLVNCTLHAMHPLRHKVLDVLRCASADLTTASVAGRCKLPPSTAHRHLEDLCAHGVIDLIGEAPERWAVSEWLRSQWWAVGEDHASEPAISDPLPARRETIGDLVGIEDGWW
jgi:hypothetical protein